MRIEPGMAAIIACVAMCLSTTALGGDGGPSVEVHPIGTIGFTTGGDTLGTYRVEYLGDESEVEVDVDAGDSLFLYGGFQMRWPETHLGMLFQGGLAIAGVGGYGDGVDFRRWPVEAIGFVEAGKFRLGIGATHHFAPTFDEDGVGDDIRVEFDDANGWIAQIEYHSGPATFGLRYVDIGYDVDTLEIDGEHWGLFGTYIFGLQVR